MLFRTIENALYAFLHRRRIERCDHTYREVKTSLAVSDGTVSAWNTTPVEQCSKCGHTRFQPVTCNSTTNRGIELDGTSSLKVTIDGTTSADTRTHEV